MTGEATTTTSRRELLGLSAAALGAAVGLEVLTASPAAAADGDAVLLARTNQAHNPTVIEIIDSGAPGLRVTSRTDDGSIMAENSANDGYALSAAGQNIGVNAVGGQAGVYTVSDQGDALRALTYDGVAIRSVTAVDAGHAIWADGAVHFSRSGRATVDAGRRSVVVAAAVRGTSSAIATLQTRQAGTAVEAAVPDAGTRTLTIWLSRRASAPLEVAWMLLD
jgi:hypothetical protein